MTAAILTTVAYVWYHHSRQRELVQSAMLLVGLLATQVTLGALTVLSRLDVWINSAHVVGGALVLATSLVLTLRSWRVRFSARGIRPQPDYAALPGDVRLEPVAATATGATSAPGARA